MISVEQEGEVFVASMVSEYSGDVDWVTYADCPLTAIHRVILLDIDYGMELKNEDPPTW